MGFIIALLILCWMAGPLAGMLGFALSVTFKAVAWVFSLAIGIVLLFTLSFSLLPIVLLVAAAFGLGRLFYGYHSA